MIKSKFVRSRIFAAMILAVLLSAFIVPIKAVFAEEFQLLNSKLIFCHDIDASGGSADAPAGPQGEDETVLTFELASRFNMPSVRQKYVDLYSGGNRELDSEGAELALQGLRTECKAYYEDLRGEFSNAYGFNVNSAVSSPFVTVTVNKRIETVMDLNANLASAVLDVGVVKVYVNNNSHAGQSISASEDPVPSNSAADNYITEEQILAQINAPESYVSNFTSKIGIAELADFGDGRPMAALLPGVNIITSSGTSSHATMVTKMSSMIASNAEYYCESADEKSIQRMIDNGVHVINMSYNIDSLSNTSMTRYSLIYARTIDKFAYDNAVNFVASSGNSFFGDTPNVDSPGIGYNIITVGASNVSGNDKAPFSNSDIPNQHFPVKPNIMAPGENIYIPELYDVLDGLHDPGKYVCGTSFATPLVTGTVAVMIEKDPWLCLYPETIRSRLYSSADETVFPDAVTFKGIRSGTGAGMLNVAGALDCGFGSSYFVANDENAGRYISSDRYYLAQGEKLKVCLSWLTDYDDQVSIYDIFEMTIFDLCLFNESGALLLSTESAGAGGNENYEAANNVAIITFTIPADGFYYVNILQTTPLRFANEHLSLASNKPSEPVPCVVEEGYRGSNIGEVSWKVYSDNTAVIEGVLWVGGSVAWWLGFTFTGFEALYISNDCGIFMIDNYALCFETPVCGFTFIIKLTGVDLSSRAVIIMENSFGDTSFGGFNCAVYSDGTAFTDADFWFYAYGTLWFDNFTFTAFEVLSININCNIYMESDRYLIFEASGYAEIICVIKLTGVVYVLK